MYKRMKNIKKEKGITLVALVVTIVVLLILAAVSISMLGGENGIITQAIRAKEETTREEEREAISVAYTACKTKDYSKDVITSGEMQEEINKIKNNVVVSMSGEDLIVYFQDTEHGYTVNQNGQISETDLNENSIIDMIDANIAVTLSGKVIYIDDSQFTQEQLLELNIEDYTVITENGVRKTGYGIFVDNEGKVYTWGKNNYGQLGNGTNTDSNIPICISDLDNDLKGKNIIDIYTAYSTIFALDPEGKIYTWGANYNGQLGDGTNNNSNVPICISELENDLKGKRITNIYTSSSTIFALDTEGKIYAWGYNYFGQLGDGTTNSSNIPICISDLENDLKGKNIVKIYIDTNTIFALDTEGKIYSWGYNYHGELGDGTNNNRNNPICISELENALKGKNIIDIDTVSSTIFALDTEGKIYTWGSNAFGLLGNGTTNSSNIPICISDLNNALKGKKIVDIYTGSYNIIVKDNEGKIYTWGNNRYGQVGDGITEVGDGNYRNTPICISDLDNDIKGKNIVDIYFFDSYTVIVIDNEGKIYAWGHNGYGQLGNGNYESSNTPICISDLEGNVLNGEKIKKYCNINFGSSYNYNSGYCYLTQDGKVYYYYYRGLV